MKRILIVIVIMILLLCGCGSKKEKEETEETQKRFVIEYQQTFDEWKSESISIIRDTKTGKAYLFEHRGYAGGLTILMEDE